jgi:putative tricarboxylic transport membrane protein
MSRLNRDAITASSLLVLCGVLFWQTFHIREVPFSQVGSEVWPRVILLMLTVLSVIYLFRSLSEPVPTKQSVGWNQWLKSYRNPLVCFGMFLLFLFALPWLGMLVAGILFVFITQSIIGGANPRQLAMHAVISILSVGGMWAIFKYALGTHLPPGELFYGKFF